MLKTRRPHDHLMLIPFGHGPWSPCMPEPMHVYESMCSQVQDSFGNDDGLHKGAMFAGRAILLVSCARAWAEATWARMLGVEKDVHTHELAVGTFACFTRVESGHEMGRRQFVQVGRCEQLGCGCLRVDKAQHAQDWLLQACERLLNIARIVSLPLPLERSPRLPCIVADNAGKRHAHLTDHTSSRRRQCITMLAVTSEDEGLVEAVCRPCKS